MEQQNQNNQSTVVSGAPTAPQVVQPPVVQMPGAQPATTPTPETPIAAPTITPTTGPSPKKLNLPKIDPKELPKMLKNIPLKFKLMGGFVILLFVLLILASFTKKGRQVTQLILPSPSPIPASSPVGEVLNPTQYATDADILNIEKTLSEFDSKLAGTDLKEDSLRVPTLDYLVDFTKQ